MGPLGREDKKKNTEMDKVQRGMGDSEVQLSGTQDLGLSIIRDKASMASYRFLLSTETEDQRDHNIFSKHM